MSETIKVANNKNKLNIIFKQINIKLEYLTSGHIKS